MSYHYCAHTFQAESNEWDLQFDLADEGGTRAAQRILKSMPEMANVGKDYRRVALVGCGDQAIWERKEFLGDRS